MKIKAILFDIDDTLFPSTEFAGVARKKAVRAMIGAGLGINFETALRKLNSIVREKGSNYPRHFNLLCERLGYKKNARIIAAGIAAYHDAKRGIRPFPEVRKTLLKLRGAGYKIYGASNGNAVKQWEKLIRLGLAHLFDDVFVSEELGCEKSPSFYRKILKKLSLKGEECIIVGDRLDNDILPAAKVGMRTVRILKGKYSKEKGKSDYSIHNLAELLGILGVK